MEVRSYAGVVQIIQEQEKEKEVGEGGRGTEYISILKVSLHLVTPPFHCMTEMFVADLLTRSGGGDPGNWEGRGW